MLVSRGRNPNASEVIGQLITNPGLRSRVLTTLGLLLLVCGSPEYRYCRTTYWPYRMTCVSRFLGQPNF